MNQSFSYDLEGFTGMLIFEGFTIKSGKLKLNSNITSKRAINLEGKIVGLDGKSIDSSEQDKSSHISKIEQEDPSLNQSQILIEIEDSKDSIDIHIAKNSASKEGIELSEEKKEDKESSESSYEDPEWGGKYPSNPNPSNHRVSISKIPERNQAQIISNEIKEDESSEEFNQILMTKKNRQNQNKKNKTRLL